MAPSSSTSSSSSVSRCCRALLCRWTVSECELVVPSSIATRASLWCGTSEEQEFSDDISEEHDICGETSKEICSAELRCEHVRETND